MMLQTRHIGRTLHRAVEAGHIPGAVAAAAAGGSPILEEAFGWRNVVTELAMTPDTVFWIASLTKPITTVAAMQMVERGKLQLDQPAGEILEDLRSPQVLEGFDVGGEPRLRPAHRPVTLRHLLTHTAGFTYDVWNPDAARYVQHVGLPGIFSCSDEALRTPLAFDPGERWEYGTNVDWAGKMVERVSGQRLEDYFRDHIFSSLSMVDTGFRLGPSQRSRLATMHQRQADGSLKPIEFEVPQDPEFYMGGGGLYSTASDYLKFTQLFLDPTGSGAREVLRPETVAQMSRNQIGDLDVVRLESGMPQSAADVEFFPGMAKKWGFGFMINSEDAPTGRSAGSLAWIGAANSYFWIDPRRSVAGVLMMQFFPLADPHALQVFSQFESGIYKMV